MAITVSGGFGDSTHGTMRRSSSGTGIVTEVVDITIVGDYSATVAVPTTLTKLVYFNASVDVTAVDVSTAWRGATSASICTSGPWIDISFGDATTGTSDALFRYTAVGW
jgi:hypothetical protein